MKRIKRGGIYFVYIIECKDGTYYTGCTKDLEKRLKEHNHTKRGAKYTRGRGPVRVVWGKEYSQRRAALRTERAIKALTRRQKELLVSGRRLDKVLALAQSAPGKSSANIYPAAART